MSEPGQSPQHQQRRRQQNQQQQTTPGRLPLHERSDSQRNVNANSLSIRIVPYSPPRPSDRESEESDEGEVGGNDQRNPLENITPHVSGSIYNDGGFASGAGGSGNKSSSVSVGSVGTGGSGGSGGNGVGGSGSGMGYSGGRAELFKQQQQRSHDGSNSPNSTSSFSRGSVMTSRARREQQYPSAISAADLVAASAPLAPAAPARALDYATGPGSALSSASSLALSLVRLGDEGVSGLSRNLPTSPVSPTSPVVNISAYHSNVSAVNAASPSLSPSLSPSPSPSPVAHHHHQDDQNLSSLSLPSLSPSLSPSPTLHPSWQSHSHSYTQLQSQSQSQLHVYDTSLPAIPVLQDLSPSPSARTSPLLRPISRRRHFVSINQDKTFTLVPLAERTASAASSAASAAPAHSNSAHTSASSSSHLQSHSSHPAGVTEFGALRTTSSGSPPVSSTFSTLSTLSTVTALDRHSSDIFSDDRPSSPLTTIPDDRTASPTSPKTPIQKLRQHHQQQQHQHQHQHQQDLIYDSDPIDSHSPDQQEEQTPRATVEDPIASSPWNYRLVGGLRKVPHTPNLRGKGKGKGKGKERSDEYQPGYQPDYQSGLGQGEQTPEQSSPASFTTTRSPTTIEYDSPTPLPTLPPLAEVDSPAASGFNLGASGAVAGIGSGHRPHTTGAGLSFETDFSRPASPATAQSQPYYNLNPKASFQSAASTLSDRTNYKLYGQSSPVQRSEDDDSLLELPSSSHSNYVLLGESSPAASFNHSLPVAPSSDIDSNDNYVLHGDPSPSTSLVALNKAPHHQFSQESLIIQPLRLGKKKGPFEKFGYYRQRSRESLRSQPSLKSLSSIATQEAARVFFAAPTVININLQTPSDPLSVPAHSSKTNPKSILASPSSPSDSPGFRDPSWAGFPSGSPLPSPKRVRMDPHAHIWSTQLSTVMSESEGGSEPPGSSRSPSAFSGSAGGARSSGRRSSGFSFFGGTSLRSKRIGSTGSSIAAEETSTSGGHSRSHSRNNSLDRPQPAYTRPSPGPSRTVRDQDEHGDGLADLHDLQNRPSRSGLSSLFRNNNSSDRNLHSSSSSRNGSFTSSSLPTWARVYYGSGERKLASMPSISSLAESTGRHDGSWGSSGSPPTDNLPLSIYSPRQRTRDVYPAAVAGPSNPNLSSRQRVPSETGSMDVGTALPGMSDFHVQPLRRKPSSVWSPHLRFDRHASRYSVWDPPSVQWSAESGPLGRRNAQVILFVSGFLLPLTWIVAAFLPLPPDPKVLLQEQMVERGGSSSTLDLPAEVEHTRNGAADETRYQSARWWRTLNRFMAIFGILIMAAAIVLVVVGIRQKWGQ